MKKPYKGARRKQTWFERLIGIYWVGDKKYHAWCGCEVA